MSKEEKFEREATEEEILEDAMRPTIKQEYDWWIESQPAPAPEDPNAELRFVKRLLDDERGS